MKAARRQTSSTATRVLKRIRAKGRGSVFVPTDFLDLDSASRRAVDAALARLVGDGTIRRIGQGVYDYPKVHPRFGPRTPSADAVASAVARSTNETIVDGDARAANLLGVSTQVPAQAVYLTTGNSRTLRVNLGNGRGFDIRFKRVASSRTLGSNSKAGLVLRALHFLGRDGVDDAVVRRLRAVLDEGDLRQLRNLRPKATGWKRSVIDCILNLNRNLSVNSIRRMNRSSDEAVTTTGAEVPVA
ncbi:MAG: DUF6088 family protein [Planctomycetota bacterium]